MEAIPPTLPFHVARAYAPAVAPRVYSPAPQAVAASGMKIEPVRGDSVELTRRVTSPLVAAKVPGKVRFDTHAPATPGTYSMYKRPADKNAAATAVDVGRTIDLNG